MAVAAKRTVEVINDEGKGYRIVLDAKERTVKVEAVGIYFTPPEVPADDFHVAVASVERLDR